MKELCIPCCLKRGVKTQWGDSKDSNAGSKHQNWGAVSPKQVVCKALAPLLEGREPEEEDREFN